MNNDLCRWKKAPYAGGGEYVLGFHLFVICGKPHLQINGPVNQNPICQCPVQHIEPSVQFSEVWMCWVSEYRPLFSFRMVLENGKIVG